MATEADNVNSGALATLLTVGAFATLGIAFVVTALVRSEMSEEAEKKDVGADRAYRDVAAEQRAKLDAPAAYVDRSKGLVSLPIERAMELTVQGLKKDPTSATPPAPAGGGSGGAASAATGGSGGAASATPEGGKPAEEKKDKSDAEKKKAPVKPAPGVVKPAPAVPAPAPAAPPAP